MSNVTLEWINTFYEIATYAVNVLICLYMSVTMIFNSSNVRKYFCNWWQILSYQLIDINWSEFDALEIIENILPSKYNFSFISDCSPTCLRLMGFTFILPVVFPKEEVETFNDFIKTYFSCCWNLKNSVHNKYKTYRYKNRPNHYLMNWTYMSYCILIS